MPFVPKRNIDRHVHDVAHPTRDSEEEAKAIARAEFMRARSPRDPEIDFGSGISVRRFMLIFLAIVVITAAGVGVQIYRTQNEVARSLETLDEVSATLPALRDLRFEDAKDQLAAGLHDIGSPGFRIESFGDITTLMQGLLSGAGNVFGDLQNMSGNFSAAVADADRLITDWPDLVLGERGQEFVALLTNLRNRFAALDEATARLAGMDDNLRQFFGIDAAQFLDFRIEIGRMKKVLDASIPIFESTTDRRVAIFLLNPAEMRPGGGFLGSYAEAVIRSGSVRDVVVRDVNEADRLLEHDIIPPQPLQGLVTRWRAADANWFFDFARSSEKTLSFLESSTLYADHGIRFEGAIGVTGWAIEQLLAESGPITVNFDGEERVVHHDTVLRDIQAKVQAGQASDDLDPKSILKALAPHLVERLRTWGSADRDGFAAFVSSTLRTRDVVLYARDPTIQNFLDTLSATGRVYTSSANDPGDYLAVVRANIGGGKSDLVLQEDVVFRSQISQDGTVSGHVEITQEHMADKDEEWWYRETNESFTKVFVPAGTRLLVASGTYQKRITPRINYAKAGYEEDADVVAQEATRVTLLEFPSIAIYREYGKAAFAYWTRTKAGDTTKTIFDYEHRLIDPPEPGAAYRFVLERQPGSRANYVVEIGAPVGYVWSENKLPIYEYASNEPAGRVVIDLTYELVPE